MANLAEHVRQLPPTFTQVVDRLKRLEEAVKFLRSAISPATAEPGLVNLTRTNFAVSAVPSTVLTATITVPPGFTSCVVNLVGRALVINSSGAVGYLTAQVNVADRTGNGVPVYAAPSGGDIAGVNITTLAVALTEMEPGSMFTVGLDAWTDAAPWAADARNLADLTGSIVWFA